MGAGSLEYASKSSEWNFAEGVEANLSYENSASKRRNSERGTSSFRVAQRRGERVTIYGVNNWRDVPNCSMETKNVAIAPVRLDLNIQ